MERWGVGGEEVAGAIESGNLLPLVVRQSLGFCVVGKSPQRPLIVLSLLLSHVPARTKY